MIKMINNLLKKIVHKWLFTYHYDLKILEGGRQPVRIYKNDAGYDLFVSKATTVKALNMTNIPTGVACKGSSHTAWILLTGRSSTLIKHGLVVDNGIIDGDYTGELFIKIYNPTKKDIHLYPGMRIGQIIVIPHTACIFNFTEELKSKTKERGNKGFGSSGL